MKNGVVKVAMLAALAVAASASPAAAAVTIGQTAPGATSSCTGNFEQAQQVTAAGNGYTVPNTGGIVNWTVTSWSTKATGVTGQVTMKIFRSLGGLTYQVVSHDGPRTANANTLNTFSSNAAAKAGDILGLHNGTGTYGCLFAATPADVRVAFNGDLGDGQSATFVTNAGERVNISAELQPVNTFTQGATTLNKKQGTATVAFDVQNPGTLTATGTGVSASSAGAHSSATVAAPGTATLLIRATGKKKKKLRSKGKVTLSPTITFTPNGGTAKSLAASVKLKIKK